MATNETSTLDLNYCPVSYFWAKERGIHLISDIQGAERRRMYANALNLGNTDEIPPELVEDALGAEDRKYIGGIHPAFMGGEYLPQKRKNEVEIARITIASTTQDVTCIYARQVGKRIYYRVVDEYDGETFDGPSTRTSTKPLTLKKLVDFFLTCWDLTACLDVNFSEHGYPREEVQGFIVDASSSFYAEFEAEIRVRVDCWLSTLPEPEPEDKEEQGDD